MDLRHPFGWRKICILLIYSVLQNVNQNDVKVRKNKLHTDELKKSLVEAAQLPTLQPGDVVVNNIRHYEALQKALASIRRVKDGLESGISGDFLSQDIRECMHFLGEITGQISNDEILGNIFGKFCIGK